MKPSEASQTPELTPLSFSQVCAGYLRARFRFNLNTRSSQSIGASSAAPVKAPDPPMLLPVHLVKELDLIGLALAGAFLNPGQ